MQDTILCKNKLKEIFVMSFVNKTMKAAFGLFGILVVLILVVGVFLYLNMDAVAKNLSEQAASKALGVPVTIGSMDISLEQKKIEVSDIAVANPKGYKGAHALTVDKIVVAGESFSKDLLVFSLVQVDGTAVNLEVSEQGVNLGALKTHTQTVSSNTSSSSASSDDISKNNIKVIVREFSLTGAQLTPSIMLTPSEELSTVNVPDIILKNIGEKENGVEAEEAVAQIMSAVLDVFNKNASNAGFLKGLSLETLNSIGISTGAVFKGNLKDSYKKELNKFKKGFGGVQGLFE